MVRVQPAHVVRGMLLQQAVPVETSPISREDIVRVGVEREHSVIMGDLPVGHLESVPTELLLLGCVRSLELPRSVVVVVVWDKLMHIAQMETVRLPT